MRNIDYRILTIEIPNSDWPRVGVIVFKLVIQTVSIFGSLMACSNEANMLVQYHIQPTCWPRLNTMLDNFS